MPTKYQRIEEKDENIRECSEDYKGGMLGIFRRKVAVRTDEC